MKRVDNVDELNELPQFSVVQFRGEALGENNRIVWQLDEAWYPAGDDDYMWSHQFPEEAFPAVVLWNPNDEDN
ncbi:hypothetical protein J4U00_gp121 [Mycobacterium phage DyoEdafos]|uniref:Uncharacterized protein n=1 Tax=Mycobacterium phage DyoEdafos TaxID=2599860 RepID=A0A5J6TIY7_9CAUD|nr:hypothetical protein J4U00_gp121 [Mycobacterium phage DyoEdafos]QFG10358.1 hypothetical protein SEA_DYOEDAFOS_148 [Mycobacterium phage DyoEdafos]